MDRRQLREDVKAVQKELAEGKEDVGKYKQPLIWILAILLIFIIVLMVVPYYAVRLDPEPERIPTIDEAVPEGFTPANVTHPRTDYLKFINPTSVKGVADRIVSLSCGSSKVCQAKALFYFVRDNFDYVSDPLRYEYIKTAEESLYYRVGDCDDAAVLLLNLEEAIGIRSRFVLIPGHVYVQIKLPDAPGKYKDWVNLDATCKSCKFGEIPYRNIKKEKRYLPTFSS